MMDLELRVLLLICYIIDILERIVGIRLLKFLRMLLSCKICAFGIILIHPGMAAECTAGDFVTTLI